MIFNDLHEKAQCTLDQLDPAVLDVSHRSDEALHPVDRMDDQMTTIENRLGGLEQETAQIRGKLEAHATFFTDLKSCCRHRCGHPRMVQGTDPLQ